MANKVTFEIIAKALGFKKAEGGVKRLSGSMKRFAAGLVTTAAAYKAIGAAIEGVQLAGRLEGVEKAFDGMRKQAGFSVNTFAKLDKALDGTVDKLTVMEQANNAMLLGIAESDDQMAEMFDTAQRLAQAVGQDATFGIESLVTGLGRQSKLMLDNLGIIVDVAKANEEYAKDLGKTASALTEAERKQAFINKALSEGKRLVDGLGEETKTSAQKIETFTASITNLKTAVGEALITSGALDTWQKWSGIIIDGANALIEQNKAASETAKIEKELATDFDNSILRQEAYRGKLDAVTVAIEKYREVEDGQSRSISKVTHQLGGLNDSQRTYLMSLLQVNTWEEARTIIAEDLTGNMLQMMQAQRSLNGHLDMEAEIQDILIKQSDDIKTKKQEVVDKIKEEATALEEAAKIKERHKAIEQEMIDFTNRHREEQAELNSQQIEDEQAKLASMEESYLSWLDTNMTSEEERLEIERENMLLSVEQYHDKEKRKEEIDKFYDKKKKAFLKAGKVAEFQDAMGSVSLYADSFAAIFGAFGKNQELVKNLTIASALADTFAGANKAFAQGGVTGFVTGAAIVAQGLGNVQKIEQAYSQASAQYGFEGVVDEPTQFTVGEAGAEMVTVTPLEGVDNAGGGGLNVVIQGNVMTDDFVENELAEKIAEAVRRGTDFGIS